MKELTKKADNLRLSGRDFEFANKLMLEISGFMKKHMNANYSTEWKADNTPVTTIDTGINDLVVNRIGSEYPNDRIFGEEGSKNGASGYTWVLDPLDGTQALGLLPTVTCCLALINREGQPVFGLIYNPATDELFSALAGEKSTVNGKSLVVSTKNQIKGSYIFLGSRISIDDMPSNGEIYDSLENQGAKILNTRSLAFSCLMVAYGKAEGAYIAMKTPFEAASVKLIVEGAGGMVTDMFGNDIGRLDGEIKGMIVSNGLLHGSMISALK
jgi:fructose-1,6-bisphosphatase/inositol monophosphatase family enzyme